MLHQGLKVKELNNFSNFKSVVCELCSGVFHFFPVKKPEIKDKDGLLTGTSWLKKQKFQQKSKVVKLP